MNNIKIQKIFISETGIFSVALFGKENNHFQYIYRSATGVDWDRSNQSFYCSRPREWTFLEQFTNIYMSVKSELGVQLGTNKSTIWENTPTDLQQEIEKYLQIVT